jgi:RHS repeat-associated protein
LHRDQLNSVRAITDRSGNLQEQRVYDPYGTQHETLAPAALTAPIETKGWIGERFDSDAALQYLNARYYDPKLAMFIQPDWWEVTKPGVGTNRYAYSMGDPINLSDPGGNHIIDPGDPLAQPSLDSPHHGTLATDQETLHEIWAENIMSDAYDQRKSPEERVQALRTIIDHDVEQTSISASPMIEDLAILTGMHHEALSKLSILGGGPPGFALLAPPRDKSLRPYNINTSDMTPAERQSVIEYARRANEYLAANGGTVVQATAGNLRTQASAAARRERARAARAGTPYSGQAGHVPDTALTGQANPPGGWLDMAGRSNNIAGGGLSSRIGKPVDIITIDGKVP